MIRGHNLILLVLVPVILCIQPAYSVYELSAQDAKTAIEYHLSPSDLIGIWASEKTFQESRTIKVELRKEIHGEQAKLVVKVNDKPVNGVKLGPDGAIQFKIQKQPGGIAGSFRGWFDSGADSANGHWIQPPNEISNHPFATPVIFKKEAHVCRGQITTRAERMRIYLNVYQTETGVRAFFRNPERNIGIQLGPRNVVVDGDVLKLTGDNGQPPVRGAARNNNRSTSKLYFTIRGSKFEFVRLDRSQASAYYPRVSGSDPYSYRTPEKSNDGWETAEAGKCGWDIKQLEKLVGEIHATETDSLGTPYIHSILIARHGKLVFEEYFYGYGKKHLHDTRSAGKSVASMLVGAAMDSIPSLDSSRTLESIFGEQESEQKTWVEPETSSSNASWEQRKAWRSQITIGNALNMASGLDMNDNDSESLGGEDRMQNQSEERNWVSYALQVPMVRQPGAKSIYGSNNINLAAAAAARATQSWLPDLFLKHIATPLSIKDYHFNLDPSGNGYMGGGIRLTARDQLKLGQVMLKNGIWKDKQILSAEWVKESLVGGGSIHETNDYGYGWWLKSIPFNGRNVKVFHASGNGGQLIICIPEFDMVIQFSGGNYGHFPVWYRHLTDFVPQKILPAIKK